MTRREWGARHGNGLGPAPIPSEWWLHHSAGEFPDLVFTDLDRDGVDDDEERVMRSLEDAGERRFKAGISYPWLVPPSGTAYIGHTMDREGAHTYGHNIRGRGICLIGNYELRPPTDAQLTTVAKIMVHEHRAGRSRTHVLNGGHRDTGLTATACPGRYAHTLIGEINRRAEALWHNASTHPTGDHPMATIQLPRTQPPPNGEPLAAWVSRPEVWTLGILREEVVGLDFVEGQHGWCQLWLSVGHYQREQPGGWLYRAHVDYSYTDTGKGRQAGPVIQDWQAPPGVELWPPYAAKVPVAFKPTLKGPATLMITYAAPGGASLAIEREK